MKKVRFTEIVKKLGAPEAVTLWTKPEDDSGFMAAVKRGCVMTVVQPIGGGKDYGLAEFAPGRHTAFLVFPKSLKDFRERRIVGIKYDLVRTAQPVGGVVKAVRPPAIARSPGVSIRRNPTVQGGEPLRLEQVRNSPIVHPSNSKTPIRVQPEPFTKAERVFSVTIQFVATTEVTVEVTATSKKDAQEKATKMLRSPDFRGATVTRKILKVTTKR